MNAVTSKKERVALGAFLICLFILAYFVFRPFLMVALLSLTVVVMTYPAYDFLLKTRLLRDRRRLSSLFMTLLLLFIIILPVTYVTSLLVDRIYLLIQTFDLREAFKSVLAGDFYVGTVEPAIHALEERLATKINVLDYLTQFIKERAVSIYQFSPKVVLGTAGYVFDFFVMLVTIYFLYAEGPALFHLLMEISPMRNSHEMQLIDQFKSTIRATIYGTVVTALIQAALSTAGFYFCRVPLAATLGLIAVFTSMVPFVGATGVWLPTAVWLLLQGETGRGVFLLMYGLLVVSSIDNFIKPLLIQGKTKNHPLLIFFSLIGGIGLMGPLGIFYGPVILASLIAAIELYRHELVKP